MTPREANVLLTQAALLDGRLRREPEERAQMSIAWAQVLVDVSLETAMGALAAHYRDETRSVMPADIAALSEESGPGGSTRPDDSRKWLLAHGVDPDEFQARVAAGETPSRVLRELGVAVES